MLDIRYQSVKKDTPAAASHNGVSEVGLSSVVCLLPGHLNFESAGTCSSRFGKLKG